jgi:DNA-directed RNA polymerase beta subunit
MAPKPGCDIEFVLNEQYENLCSLEMVNNALLARFDIDDGDSVSHHHIAAYFNDSERLLARLSKCEKIVQRAVQKATSQRAEQKDTNTRQTLINIRDKAISIQKSLALLVEKITRRRNGLSKKTLQISKNNKKMRLYAQNM